MNDKREGNGRYTFTNGEEYFGEFRNGRGEGKGTFCYVDGSWYEGEWLGGRCHGRGVFCTHRRLSELSDLFRRYASKSNEEEDEESKAAPEAEQGADKSMLEDLARARELMGRAEPCRGQIEGLLVISGVWECGVYVNSED